MPNAIKYNTSAETLALKKGNFWIGTGGPTIETSLPNMTFLIFPIIEKYSSEKNKNQLMN